MTPRTALLIPLTAYTSAYRLRIQSRRILSVRRYGYSLYRCVRGQEEVIVYFLEDENTFSECTCAIYMACEYRHLVQQNLNYEIK